MRYPNAGPLSFEVALKLKKVEIAGFKSFADKISLVFHDGITCIVGPNGCGKSNIADAMRWVFGEQSAKSLRGDKMTDVIFTGSSSRKSLNLAEVTITFTEIGGILPLDYEEVAVTRRLHRSGESDYFINKQPVRLKDIQNVFLDTGIGRTAFSIFEQGKLDQIIQYSPVGRRALFEEAAGITRYLQRKKETLKKFEGIEQNLCRVRDIFKEVEIQIVKLEEQSKKAKIYQNNRASLENLEREYFYAQHNHFLKKEMELCHQQEMATLSLADLQTHIDSKNHALKTLQISIYQQEAEYSKRHEEVQLKRGEQKVKQEKEKLKAEQLKELYSKQIEYEKEIEELKARKNSWLKEIEECQQKQQIHETTVKKAADEFAAKETSFHALEGELVKLRDRQTKSHKEKMAHLQAENQVVQDLKTLRMRFENHQEKKNQFEERIQRLNIHVKELETLERDKKEAFQNIIKASDLLKKELAELDAQIKENSEQINHHSKLVEEAKKVLQESTARSNALSRLKEENEGFSAGSKKILQEAAKPGSPLFGIAKALYECISVNSGYERDLATILKRYSETIVVERLAELKLLIDFAEAKKIQDFSVICLEVIGEVKKGKLKKSLLENATDSTLSRHFLGSVAIIEDLDQAFEQGRKGFEGLTADKLFIDSFQVIHVRPAQENSIFVREAEIKKLTNKIKQYEENFENLEKTLKEIRDQKSKLQSKRSQLDSAIRASEIQLVEANFHLQKVHSEKEKTIKETGQVLQEIESIEQTLKQLHLQNDNLDKKLLEERKKTVELAANDSSIEENLLKAVEERKWQVEELDSKRKNLFILSDENKRNQHALNLLEVKKQESDNSLKRMSEELTKLAVRIKQLKEGEATSKEEEAKLEVELQEKQNGCRHLQEEVNKKKEEAKQLYIKLEDLQKEMKTKEKNMHHLEVQLAQVKTSKQGIIKTIEERLGVGLIPESVELSFEKAEKEMKMLRQKLEDAKDINLAAIDDFEKSKERYQFLDEQIQDLTKAKKELEDAILTLDEESREIFEKTFKQIKENFKKNFNLLFNGGEADLELVESKDVLEAGVEIIAKPPGKQMRSLSLLSGGEKCLTAMALLFSIFEVKASPFCILDEIDAPLDDSNIERFVHMVKQFVDRCQFIIITHNKQTMSIADRIFGVSMQEKGVSKMLSIEFEGARELVEIV